MPYAGAVKDTAVTVYIAGAVGAWSLTDFNQYAAALGLSLGIALAGIRIAKAVKYWNDPTHKD